jgi:hypothetical protein
VVALPEWLVAGLAIAAGLAALFAILFAVGEWLFPTTPVEAGREASGEWKRRAEIREYLDAIDEPYAEDHPVAGQTVAFYLPERDVAITFDARAYFRIEKTDTHAVLVEHEMPGIHLGARLPFETPDVDVGPEAADGSVEAAFSVLGLQPGASEAEVQAAYREKVKEAHPDHGGDEETFRRVREAYTAASEAAVD